MWGTVLYKDPQLSKQVAGHAPGKRPLRGPFVVVRVRGNKCDIKDAETACEIKDVHADYLVGLPGATEDLELVPEVPGERLSPGQLLELARRPKPAAAELLAPRARARLKEVRPGRFVAYEAEGPKRCQIGKVLSVAEDLSSVTLHVFNARAGDRLQVVWEAAFSRLEGADVQSQVVETIEAKRILGPV